jgi:hypothetical protein
VKRRPAPIALRPFGVLYRIESGQWEVEWEQTFEAAQGTAEAVALQFPNSVVQIVERKAACQMPDLQPIWSRA